MSTISTELASDFAETIVYSSATRKVMAIGKSCNNMLLALQQLGCEGFLLKSVEQAMNWFQMASQCAIETPECIVCDINMPDTEILKLTRYVNTTAGLTATPVILFADALSPAVRNRALRLNADDVYANNFDPNNVMFRIDSLRRFKAVIQNAKEPIQPQKNEEESLKHKMSAVILMLLNMAGALVAIVLAAPVIFIAAILIKLESRGPVFYVSKRVGRNYKIFNFYKLRTMRVGADAELATIKHLNQYAKSGDGTENMFIKIENDPRVTAVGRFLRKTSIDELPQIFHVLKGEMAFVGNRPLPLYEAETLTRDYCAYRFIAPAGITGKWQIMQRGKKEVTAEGRIQLDVEQAKEAHNILMVIKTMFLTIPALFQKADV